MTISQRQTQKERTRNHILEIAFQQFAAAGFTKVRTADIATAAGLSHGALFVHFANRDELLNAVLETFGSAIAQRLHASVDSGRGIRPILESHLDGLREFESFYSRLITERSLLPEAAQHTLLGIQSIIAFHLIQAAEAEMQSGAIRTMPPHLLFNTWIALIHYYLTNRDWFAPKVQS